MIKQSNPPAAPGAGIIRVSDAGTLWELFCERVRRSPDAVAYKEYDPSAGNWRAHTWRSIAARASRFRCAFARDGLRAGDHVAVLLPNGIDWVSFDVAAHGSGLVVIGLYPRDTAASNAAILGHSDARLVFLDTQARWCSLAALRAEFPLLGHVWVRDPNKGPASPPSGLAFRSLADILADESSPPAPHQAAPADVATLIYTSGTAGPRKSVMLSHSALIWNAATPAAVVPPRQDDVFLSVLPLAHAFARTADYYLPMIGGSTVAYARSPKELREDLLAVRPTVIFGVPFLFERIAASILKKAEDSLAKRILLRVAAFTGWQLFQLAQRPGILGLAERALLAGYRRFAAASVLAAFGGRLRVAISGGAPLDPNAARLLIGLGLPLIEGYGLSEAGPVVSVNGLDDNVPGSSGRPLPGVEVKLSKAGELMVRSPSAMTGYWKDEARTARVLDVNGWLSTGDLAEIRDGRIFIRGRIEDAIVLSIGEKLNPAMIEAEIASDPLFEQAMVVGERRPYVAALIVLDSCGWRRFAAESSLDPEQPNQPASKAAILARLTSRLAKLPRYCKIRAVHLTLTPWTVEAGLLTPTLKIRRAALQRKFAAEIDALYAER
jgi:long-chain acyl-CoA synthetase